MSNENGVNKTNSFTNMYRKAYEKIKLNKLIVIKALEMPSKEKMLKLVLAYSNKGFRNAIKRKNVKISTCGININI